ncbi:MAG TPA: hypothetical protein VK169_19550 [Saprospiraceae bacterium]|nr:hypothetical protein [Saprospiraceae bacterium]
MSVIKKSHAYLLFLKAEVYHELSLNLFKQMLLSIILTFYAISLFSQTGTLPMQKGMATLTCFSGITPNSDDNGAPQNPNGYVLAIFDIRDPGANGAPSNPPTNWNGATTGAYHHPSWTASNMGELFGVALQEGATNPAIFASTTGITATNYVSLSPKTGGTGGEVYRIDGNSGNITTLTTLPNTTYTFDIYSRYVGLGDITYNRHNNVVYVSNLDNGLVYAINASTGAILGSPYNHNTTTSDNTGLPFTQVERMVFGLGYNDQTKLLYYAVKGGGSLFDNNQIYTLSLNPDGSINAGSRSATPVIEYSFPGNGWGNIISDIAFSADGSQMLIAEMNLNFETAGAVTVPSKEAHYANVLKYGNVGGTWALSLSYQGHLGVFGAVRGNSAGGVDFGFNNFGTNSPTTNLDDAAVMTADQILGIGGSGFGFQISNIEAPISYATSYIVDLDGTYGDNDKFTSGDIEVFGDVINCDISSVTALPTTCNPNNNQYAVSGQVTFVGPPASGTLTVAISGGGTQVFNAPFTSPINYTINGQVSDGQMKTVTATFSALLSCTNTTTYTAPSNCAPTGTCGCTEYIYLNEPEAQKVLKFRVGSNVPLTEIPGQGGGAWYPGSNTSELPFPHGIATDLNGFLYIAERSQDGNIRKLNCDGDIFPVTGTTINDTGVHTNMFSIGNTLYVTGLGGPKAYDLCTGDLLGQMCLSDANGVQVGGTPWGLSYNAVSETVYASGLTGNRIWAFSRAQLEAGIAGTGACITPLIQQGPNATVNIGENFTPNAPTGVLGVVGDDSGNIYVVESAVVGGTGTYVLKYDVNGLLLATSPVDNVLGGGGYYYGMGMVWSETSNRLYVSNRTNDLTEDCIAAFNASTMAYLGPGAPNPLVGTGPTSGKALGIIKECCPVNLPSAFQREVCGAVGTKFYLNQEAFNDCDGTVCGSSWTPTSLNGMTFDPCDNSVTVTGVGCSTFTLGIGAVTSTGCGPQNSTFTICNNLPSASFTPLSGTCNASGPNNDARINVINATYANQAGISAGNTYTGPAYGGMGIISLAGGSGTFTGLMHVTIYTVRVFNGSNECYVDFQVNTPSLECCNISSIVPQNITCYDNGTPGQITDNKIRFNANITNSNALLTSYNVTISGGTTITPNTNVPYGITQFTLGAGTAGSGGTFTITFTDSQTPGCTEVFTITDPGNCAPSVPLCPPVQCGTATIQVNGN